MLKIIFTILTMNVFCLTLSIAQSSITVSSVKDNSIYEESKSNSGGNGSLYAGRNCRGNERRALVQFNLSAIPQGAKITSASLSLNVSKGSSRFSSSTFTVHAINKAWGEGSSSSGGQGSSAMSPDATWSNAQHTSSSWQNEGGDFNAAALSSASFSSQTGTFSFPSGVSFVNQVQSWVDNPNTNFGLLIKDGSSSNCTARQIGSKESGTTPKLTVMWTLPCNATQSSINQNVCTSYTLPSGKRTVSTTGIYSDTIPNKNGCDSIITIDLIVRNNTSSSIARTASDTLTSPSGKYTYRNSGVYRDTISNAAGCDSIITINLTIPQRTVATISPSSCSTYTPPSGKQTFETSGTYLDSIPNNAGFDSIITINLTIINIDTGITLSGGTLEAAQVNASYQWLDCQKGKQIISGAKSQQYLPTEIGDYAVEITIGACKDTSTCTNIATLTSINPASSLSIAIYPNPTQDYIYVSPSAPTLFSIRIIDLEGKELFQETDINSVPYKIDARTLPHLSILEVRSQGKTSRHKLVREK